MFAHYKERNVSHQQWNGPQGPGNGGPGHTGQPGYGGQGGAQPPQGGTRPGAPNFNAPQAGQQPHYNAPQQGGYQQQPQGNYGPQGPGSQGPQGGYGPGGYGPQGPIGGAPTKKKSKVPVIIGGVVAAGLLAGGGYFAYSFFNGASPAAATSGIPKDAIAVIELSLNPADSDKLALKNIIEKFPVSDDMQQTDDYKESLWNFLESTSSDDEWPDYETKVKPWLGDSISLGVIADDDQSSPVIAVEVTDEDKAGAFVDENAKEPADLEYFFHDGLMIVHEPDDDIEAALKEGSLQDSEEYKSDMDALDGGNLATAWFSSEGMKFLIDQVGMQPGAAQLPQDQVEQIEALKSMHGAVGLHVEDNMLSLHTTFTSDIDSGKSDDVRDFAGSLPKDASMAVGLSFNEQMISQVWQQLGQDSSLQDQLSQLGINSEEDLRAVLGKQIAIGADGFLNGEDGKFGLKVKTDDVERHQSIVDPLFEQLEGSGSEPPVERAADGDTVTYVHGYSADDIKGGSLKDNDLYKKVITDDAQNIVFLNVDSIMEQVGDQMDDEDKQYLEPVAAVGVTAKADGKNGKALIKIAFDE